MLTVILQGIAGEAQEQIEHLQEELKTMLDIMAFEQGVQEIANFQLDVFRKIKHLSLLDLFGLDAFQTCLAMPATFHYMHFPMVRLLNRFQSMTDMPKLTPRFLVSRTWLSV